MKGEEYPLVDECSEKYEVTRLPDGGIRIEIRVSRRFADPWRARLEQLTTTNSEIRAFDPDVSEA
jgi:hypothetical protein